MLIKEYRVTLPLTVEEYQVAQLFCVAEASKDNTGGGEGIEVLKNEPFDNYPLLSGQYAKGQYTYKIYHIASKVPAFIRLLLPKGSLEIHEEAWNAYPYCRTVITENCSPDRSPRAAIAAGGRPIAISAYESPMYFSAPRPGSFQIVTEALNICFDHLLHNVGSPVTTTERIIRKRSEHVLNGRPVHMLPPDKLKQREVVHVDIANDKIDSHDYKKEEDPTLFKSAKTGRGPLVGKWQEKCKPVMTCYKLVTCEFKWFGLQTRVENLIQKTERRLFTTFHRQVFCSMDRWYGLTMADIRAIEEKTKHELDSQRHQGQVRGMKAEAE